MKTVTLVCWRRPEYTARVIEALERCRGRNNYRLVVSVDGPRDHEATLETERIVREARPYFVTAHEVNRGVAMNPPIAYDAAFALGSSFNLAIEDDCVLSPDALELADWFCELPERDQYLLMSLGATSDGTEDPQEVRETDQIESPWAWCFTNAAWHWMKPRWNSKRYPPTGHDWSLSLEMALARKKALYVPLSRGYNIGQYGGIHTKPESYEEELGRCSPSNGSYQGPYHIKRTLPAGHSAFKLWMDDELNARGLTREAVA